MPTDTTNAAPAQPQIETAPQENHPPGEPPPWLLPVVKRAVEEALRSQPAGPRFVELPEILRQVPVGERTFREWMRRGLVPYCRFPGARRILFDPVAVHAAVSRFSKGGGIQ